MKVFDDYKINSDNYLKFLVSELKPFIDKKYSTYTNRENTFVAGSSMGGQASLWFGWDRPDVFGRLGVFSGAWSVFTTGFYDKVRAEAKRSVRIYLDSGDSGASQDLFWTTVNLRDNLINPARASGAAGPFALERDLRYAYGPGQSHNEAAWAARLPGCLEFLLPASEAPNELASLPSARPADVNDDALVTIEDLYAWEQGTPAPASSLDVDRDGTFEPQEDRAALLSALRGGEATDLAAGL
jgi:pimeloyl-ACP methyl ester carboxylesterase